MRYALALALAAAAALALSTSGLALQGGSGDLTLSNPNPGQYEGKVVNSSRKCRKRRSVTVKHDQDEDGYDRADFTIGTDRTNRRGRYSVTGPQAPEDDQIAAKAKPKDGCRAIEVVATAG